MKLLMLNSSDVIGGAAKAAYRLHESFTNKENEQEQSEKIESKMFVQKKQGKNISVIEDRKLFNFAGFNIYNFLDAFISFIFPSDYKPLSPTLLSSISEDKLIEYNPDIFHLHWICNGFMRPEILIKLNKPIVWTLQDMWAFCGAEHHTNSQRYVEGYSKYNCSIFQRFFFDINKKVWNRKCKVYEKLNHLNIVCSSRWLLDKAKNSYLFKKKSLHLIYNGLNINYFKPLSKILARKYLKLLPNKIYIGFGAMNYLKDKKKGFYLFYEALNKIKKFFPSRKISIILFGSDKASNKLIKMPFPTLFLGKVHLEYELINLYNSLDLLVVPSIRENIPNVIIESLSCGVPVVSFSIGGIPEQIDHKLNGYLAKPFEIDDLAFGIKWILEHKGRYQYFKDNAREKVKNYFDISMVKKNYINLYKNILEK